MEAKSDWNTWFADRISETTKQDTSPPHTISRQKEVGCILLREPSYFIDFFFYF